MADIDPNSAPSLMPAEQAIAKPDGKATTPMLDWLSALRNWTKRSVVDLTTKITTLISDMGDVSAAIVEEASIRETEDGILASQIVTVEAKADNATANGEIYFQAMAGPAGSAAAYGIFLTAGDVFTGLMLIAESGGGSHIVMTAGSLQFYDSASGSQINVLTYAGGEWLLNGNVTILSANGNGSFRMADGNLVIRDASNNPLIELGINL